jgi:hypothetical protein
MNNSKTASILKGEILGFADNISAGLSKPEKKAVRELLLGMIGRGSCLVTEISRGFKDTVRFKKVLERLSRHLSKAGLGEKLQENYLKNRFIVRLKGNRHLLYGTRGKSKNVLKLAKKVRCQVRETVKFTRKGRQIVTQMDYGSRKVKLPSLPDVELNLVVIKNLRGEVKAIFLTNLACGSRKNLNMVVKGYFLRWTVEEIIRFRKQEFDLENIRVRSWVKLQNLTTLALISAGKVGLQSFNELISIHILTFAKRANGIKRFSLYAVREGISFLLNHFMITRKAIPKPCCNQLTLFEISHFSRLESL